MIEQLRLDPGRPGEMNVWESERPRCGLTLDCIVVRQIPLLIRGSEMRLIRFGALCFACSSLEGPAPLWDI